MDTPKIKVLIVDDHPMLRHGISLLINSQDDLFVCGEAENAQTTMSLIASTQPDIVTLDISLPGTNGIELLKMIRNQYSKLPVLVVSMHDEFLYAKRAIRAGAAGYIMKEEATEKIAFALRHILDGNIYLSDRIQYHLIKPGSKNIPNSSPATLTVSSLSDRELEIFQLLGSGQTIRNIAGDLHLSVKTVESHREHLKKKFKLQTSTQLVREAVSWVKEQNSNR